MGLVDNVHDDQRASVHSSRSVMINVPHPHPHIRVQMLMPMSVRLADKL